MAKSTRSIQDINNAYFRKSAELGHLEWQLKKIPGQIASIESEIREIDREMDRAQAQKLKDDQDEARAAAQKARAKAEAPQPTAVP